MAHAQRALQSTSEPQLDSLYADIQSTFQISWIPPAFGTLGQVPNYLRVAWKALKPAACTEQFARMAERVHRQSSSIIQAAYSPSYGPGDLQQLGVSLDDQSEVRTMLEALLYGQSQTLIALTALRVAADGHSSEQHNRISWPRRKTTWAMEPIAMVQEDTAGETVRQIFDNVRDELRQPDIPWALRVIARWPRYLELAWPDLQELFDIPLFWSGVTALRDEAATMCDALPCSVDASPDQLRQAGIDRFEINRARDILHACEDVVPTDDLVTSSVRYPLAGHRG